jgi:hypothetical protein
MAQIDQEHVLELPRRFALTLVDTSSFLGPSMLGTDPVPADPSSGGTQTTSTDLLSGAMGRVSDASALAQASNAGAQAQNIDSPGSMTFASAP